MVDTIYPGQNREIKNIKKKSYLQIVSKMFPPPGFVKPIWRGWEQPGDVRANLAVAVTAIEKSLGSCHRAKVVREPTVCPSSNQHHYVRQVPHRCEALSTPTRKMGNKGNT